jgi:HAD superfamily hydrolase (TIGR01509 family)
MAPPVKLRAVPQAVLFDLDGILLDTEPLYTIAISELTRSFGKEYSWELKSRSMGTHPRSSAQLVIDALGLPIGVDEWLARRMVRLEQLFLDVPAMPGAPEFVEGLRARGVPHAVATSSERRLCELKWAKHPWLQEFDTVVCGDDPGVTRLKPAPDIYLEAARRLGIAPEQCVVFEDAPAGVAAGKAAGAQVVCVKAEELDPAMVAAADLIVSSYAEVSFADCGFD